MSVVVHYAGSQFKIAPNLDAIDVTHRINQALDRWIRNVDHPNFRVAWTAGEHIEMEAWVELPLENGHTVRIFVSDCISIAVESFVSDDDIRLLHDGE